MQEPSIFTKIINGEIACQKVYEDDRVIAFLEIYPINEGETLVVLKKQVNHIWDLEDDDYMYLWGVAKKIGKHIREVLTPPRVGVFVAGFGVPHVHIHIVPLYHGDDINKHPDKSNPPDNDALAKMASRLKM